MQVEKMLPDQWQRIESRKAPHLGSGSLDTGNLSELRDGEEDSKGRGLSWFVDAFTIVVAILIGVSIGFVVLKYSAPELLSKFEDAGKRLYSSPASDGLT